MSIKTKISAFIWQHFLLLVSLFFLALGVAICVRSNLGSSVISSTPYSFTLAGESGLSPNLSLGMYTNILNVILVVCQIFVLKNQFQLVQLFQLIIGTVFGVLIDFSMFLTSTFQSPDFKIQIIEMILGSTIMAFGVSLEIRCASITMPGEGLPAAISKKTGKPFGYIKIFVDIALVVSAIVSMLVFFGEWRWNIVGIGTLFAMLYCGMAVKLISNHLKWFDTLVGFSPNLIRYFYGLAKYLHYNQFSNDQKISSDEKVSSKTEFHPVE